MAQFSYGGTNYNFPGNSGLFICSTTATSGGTQSQPVYLVYRGTRKLKYYRDASTVVYLGRGKPATEVGQYSFKGMDFQYSWPANSTDYDGSTAVTGDTIESRINSIVSNLVSGNFVQLQDAKGRNLIGTFTQDPEISDELAGWRTISASMVEIG